MKRFADVCRYIGMAIALKYAMESIHAVYGFRVNLELPLPAWPGIVVEAPRVLA